MCPPSASSAASASGLPAGDASASLATGRGGASDCGDCLCTRLAEALLRAALARSRRKGTSLRCRECLHASSNRALKYGGRGALDGKNECAIPGMGPATTDAQVVVNVAEGSQDWANLGPKLTPPTHTHTPLRALKEKHRYDASRETCRSGAPTAYRRRAPRQSPSLPEWCSNDGALWDIRGQTPEAHGMRRGHQCPHLQANS